MAGRRNWSETEAARALALYLCTPFGRIHSRNPEIIELAGALERTPGAVALKMVNFAALDPELPRKGMANASATDRRVWSRFREDPEGFVQQVSAVAEPYGFIPPDPPAPGMREGTDVTAMVPQRRGQDFFRRMVLANWRERCAVTGIDHPRLLVASHIVPWAEEAALRLRPENGLCLNPLHDRAFDQGLIAFGDDLEVLVSPRLPAASRAFFERSEHRRLRLPDKVMPARELLARHREASAANF